MGRPVFGLCRRSEEVGERRHLTAIKSRMLLTDDPVDSLARRPPFYEIAQRLAAHNPKKRHGARIPYVLILLNGQIARIYGAFFQGDSSAAPMDTAAMPRVCQEPALMYLEATGQTAPPAAARRILETTTK